MNILLLCNVIIKLIEAKKRQKRCFSWRINEKVFEYFCRRVFRMCSTYLLKREKCVFLFRDTFLFERFTMPWLTRRILYRAFLERFRVRTNLNYCGPLGPTG